jgi:hypothetical protein
MVDPRRVRDNSNTPSGKYLASSLPSRHHRITSPTSSLPPVSIMDSAPATSIVDQTKDTVSALAKKVSEVVNVSSKGNDEGPSAGRCSLHTSNGP